MNRQDRYKGNGASINESDQRVLKKSIVCVLGCGGLGGYTIEMLARVGVGTLVLVDKDKFEETNLNRQLLSTKDNLGCYKVDVAKERLEKINDEVSVIALAVSIDKENGASIIEKCDVVVDALDNILTRKSIASICSNLKIPYIHGAISGWYGQVSTILPNENTLDVLYPQSAKLDNHEILGNPSFTPALISSIQVSEVLKVLLCKGNLLTNGFMHIDLLTNDMEKVMFDQFL